MSARFGAKTSFFFSKFMVCPHGLGGLSQFENFAVKRGHFLRICAEVFYGRSLICFALSIGGALERLGLRCSCITFLPIHNRYLQLRYFCVIIIPTPRHYFNFFFISDILLIKALWRTKNRKQK